jgi:hypothetical protein
MHIPGRASEITSTFGFSGRVLSQILINIAVAVDPRVWAEFKGYGVYAVTVSSDRLTRASKAGPNALSCRDVKEHRIKNGSIVRHEIPMFA